MDLRAHNARQHGGQLFGLECGQCGFQTDSPKLLREHQSRMHEKEEADTVDGKAANVPADTAIPANTYTTNALDENTPAISVDKDDGTPAAGAGGTRDKETNRPDSPETGWNNTLEGNEKLDGAARSLSSNSRERTTLFTPKLPHNVLGLPVGTGEPTSRAVWQQPKLPYNSKDTQCRAGDGRPEIDTLVQKSMELISNITDLDNVFAEPSAAPQWDIELRNIGEVEAAPIKLEDDSSHVICPTCYEYLPQTHYTLHRHSRNCHHPSRPPEVTKEHSLEPHRE